MIVFQPHRKAMVALAFSPDGQRIATVSKEPIVRVWGGAKYEKQLFVCDCITSPPWSDLTFSPDGGTLVYAAGIQGVSAWPLVTPLVRKRVHPKSNAPWHAHQCCFTPDGATLLVGGISGVWRFRSADWEEYHLTEYHSIDVLRSVGNYRLERMALSPDGRLLAHLYSVYDPSSPLTLTDLVVHLRDANSGEPRGELHPPIDESIPTALAFSPSGRHLAALQGPRLRVWDVSTRTQIAQNKTGKRKLLALAFTRDGSRLVTASGDASVRLWDTATWSEVGRLDWDVGPIGCVAAAPDGMRMAAGGDTGKVVVWDVD